MKYRIGLDIGIASVGWAVMGIDEFGEPTRIVDMGSRVFDKAEVPKTGGSLSEPRRNARGIRRRLRRRAYRVIRVRELLEELFGRGITESLSDATEIVDLRFKGLDEKLEISELCRVLLYFVKHRGFKSNRKSDEESKENGELLKALKTNSEYRKANNYRTVGEMFYKDAQYFSFVNGKKEYLTRNKEKNYKNSVLRSEILDEIKLILEKQAQYGTVDEAFIEKYLSVFNSQRNFDEGPGEPSPYRRGYAIGKCLFYENEERAPKASFTYRYFSALQKINNVKVCTDGASSRELTDDERNVLRTAILSVKEMSYAQALNKLKLDSEKVYFNINYSNKKTKAETEKTRFLNMSDCYRIRKCLSAHNSSDDNLVDSIAEILSKYKSDDNRLKEFSAKTPTLSEEEKTNLLALNVSQFGNLSLRAMREIIPHLEQGCKYNEACERAGFDFRGHDGATKTVLLDTKEIHEEINSVTSPVVRRALSQTLKVLNAVIRKYGSPCAVNVEMAREMSKSFKERKDIETSMTERAKENERIKCVLQSEFKLTLPTGIDIVKYRLYEEQGGKCAYSTEPLVSARLFEPNYVQVDHIIPYSRSFDDSMNNKALVLTVENQNKKNMTPYEYMGCDRERWEKFEAFVRAQYSRNRKKQTNLLRKEFGEQESKEWKERALNDTKYISRFMFNLIKDRLQFENCQGIKDKKVISVNGIITSFVRKMWGIQKIREDGDIHHSIDACVIACVTDGAIKKITEFSKGKESCRRIKEKIIGDDGTQNVIEKFVDRNGEVLSEQEYDEKYGVRLPQPYPGYRDELMCRTANNPRLYETEFIKLGYDESALNALKPVFVSRMPRRKATGEIHAATRRSAKRLCDGIVITKTALQDLKLSADKTEILDYYDSKSDKLLYNALLNRLVEFDGDAKTAFKEVFYKPTASGKQGNPVKKVKTQKKADVGVKFENIKAFSNNGDMVRVDIFSRNKKYYAVPVYLKDVYAGVVPNKAVVVSKPYEEWLEMDESYEFVFSLFKNDLVRMESKKGFNFVKTNVKEKNAVVLNDVMCYFKGFDISTSTINVITHDNGLSTRVGIQNLLKFDKYTVDVLGNFSKVHKEKRMK